MPRQTAESLSLDHPSVDPWRQKGLHLGAIAVLRIATWVLLGTAILAGAFFLGWALLGVVLIRPGQIVSPNFTEAALVALALLVLAGMLAWVAARYFASWKQVGLVVGPIVLAFYLAVTVWALIAPYQAVYMARDIAWGDSNFYTYQRLFLSHPLQAAPQPFHFPVTPDPRVPELFANLAGIKDWSGFLAKNHTQAFIVIHDGQVVYENYYNNTQRDSAVTSFSVAKSFTSALIGEAIQDGYIQSVNDPITNYLPELARRDPRFQQITIRNLLMMSSGLDYQANRPLPVIGNIIGDDPLTTYFPNQRALALDNTRIIDPAGQYFRYNKYHPQLLGMILERTTGMSVTGYLQKKIWDPLGMEYAGSWSIDSQQSDFEKMEAGVNARAIDFAKFGQLFLNGGSWNGRQIISKEWVEESTTPYLPNNYASYYPNSPWFHTDFGKGAYGLMWWDLTRGADRYDFYAAGDHGQFIYVSPQKHLVIVRNGTDYGISPDQWLKLFYGFASQY